MTGEDRALLETLTARQVQVASCLALGMTNQETADFVGCGLKTFDSHRHVLLKKLRLRNNAELARFALRVGLVTLDQEPPGRAGSADIAQ
jgi:DNA-binding NarL/FixJ family response regulator